MDGSKIDLKATENTDNLELYIRNTEWTLTDFRVKNYIKVGKNFLKSIRGLLKVDKFTYMYVSG